ncbi:MAG: 50S ribosomal protein L3 [Candidatus Moranbacteria bacterium CG_4_9_14_3_um_filter_36_9]|nr:MAG: 50S ribosomal protein L3 [Candidatus Moranbacteria bacterium CG_4_9_14_3_um_filter_36_9]
MSRFALGKKVGMTTIYDEKEGVLNITLVECFSKVNLIRTMEKDGYEAVRLEIEKTKNKKLIREFRMEGKSEMKVGDIIKAENFSIGELTKVSGITKGKGFQGVVKRHGFKGSPKSHGHKHDLRAPGSIGSGFPEHVIKGKRMAGRMGGGRSTAKNIKIVFVDKEKNLIGFQGAIPGIPGNIIEIAKMEEKK